MPNHATLIHRYEFPAADLVREHPVRLHDRNKRAVFNLTCPPDAAFGGTIAFSRWQPVDLPIVVSRVAAQPRINHEHGFFRYEPVGESQIEWHVNFAHYDLFCAYGGPLFAQDEMQVTEHPTLASLRHALQAAGIPPLSVENGRPTPALMRGVERRCIIHTDCNAAEGRPYGLYGNEFSRASEEAVRRATVLLNPPTISNIVAMEAPACGHGIYTREEIELILLTAITGFAAVKSESEFAGLDSRAVTIHTGNWGCGAYGGNPVLMLLLQMMAAVCVGVGKVNFYVGFSGNDSFLDALALIDQHLPEGSACRLDEILDVIVSKAFAWGVSNGT